MKKTIILFLKITSAGTGVFAQGTATGKTHSRKSNEEQSSNVENYLALNLKKGEDLANVYSRTIAFSGDSIQPLVFRISGSSGYTVVDDNPQNLVLKGTDTCDGRDPHPYDITLNLSGNGTSAGKSFANTSASGLLYNEIVWGKAPASFKVGDSWKVNITVPWELGGPGEQTITVMSLDAKNQTITLKREGFSDGYYDGDKQDMEVTIRSGAKLKMHVKPGRSHWIGLTTFKNAIVQSDELMVTRPVILLTADKAFEAHERQYILLNSMPVDKL